jgi:hypothetical protein
MRLTGVVPVYDGCAFEFIKDDFKIIRFYSFSNHVMAACQNGFVDTPLRTLYI